MQRQQRVCERNAALALLQLAEGTLTPVTVNTGNLSTIQADINTEEASDPSLLPSTALNKEVQVNSFSFKHQFDIADVINNETRLRYCTRLSNIELYHAITNALSSYVNFHNFCIKKILLTLMKIRLGLTFRFLSILFNISEQSYFSNTYKLLSAFLKVFISMPEKDELVGNILKCFKDFRQCTMILDY
ncbi:hypothetical protein ILUMI_11208 [Ignelater luminosus]|uniref:Transposase Helix-turn-helix domain-containing protein n=1 Tax=Ignelater luminosus TaxID=2038154 RepID=A0A8K0G7Y9_IGNLU|nr:hypothetical protein ILUMI_11208 [Ignelater luminosus]